MTATAKVNTRHDVMWSDTRGVRLTKRFRSKGGLDKIEFKQIGGSGHQFSLPETVIDRMILALLDLKVLMRDGDTYNSGILRLAIVDGSGIESYLSDLNENGRNMVRASAEQLIEEIDEFEDQVVDDDETEED